MSFLNISTLVSATYVNGSLMIYNIKVWKNSFSYLPFRQRWIGEADGTETSIIAGWNWVPYLRLDKRRRKTANLMNLCWETSRHRGLIWWNNQLLPTIKLSPYCSLVLGWGVVWIILFKCTCHRLSQPITALIQLLFKSGGRLPHLGQRIMCSSSSSKSLLHVTFRHKRSFKWHCNTIKTL